MSAVATAGLSQASISASSAKPVASTPLSSSFSPRLMHIVRNSARVTSRSGEKTCTPPTLSALKMPYSARGRRGVGRGVPGHVGVAGLGLLLFNLDNHRGLLLRAPVESMAR